MCKKIEFRKLKACEIEPRVASVNAGGVKLLLWKAKLAPYRVLDDAVGKSNWQLVLSNDNRNAKIGIRDPFSDAFIWKEGVGDMPTPKALVEDAVSCAATAWGIGRELYNAPDLFISKDHLDSYTYNKETKEGQCFDRFRCLDISYDDDSISSVTIGIYKFDELIGQQTFGKKTANAAKQPADDALFSDDEIMQIGSIKGKTYGEVKDSVNFRGLVTWAKKSDKRYDDPVMESQLERMRRLPMAS